LKIILKSKSFLAQKFRYLKVVFAKNHTFLIFGVKIQTFVNDFQTM